jgi:hypothetical protein
MCEQGDGRADGWRMSSDEVDDYIRDLAVMVLGRLPPDFVIALVVCAPPDSGGPPELGQFISNAGKPGMAGVLRECAKRLDANDGEPCYRLYQREWPGV